jgi:hypothetical protein
VGDEPELRRQQRGEESREALLEAGVELLREEALGSLVRAISSRAVSRGRIGRPVPFFHCWPSADAYLTDLVDHILRPAVVPELLGTRRDQPRRARRETGSYAGTKAAPGGG